VAPELANVPIGQVPEALKVLAEVVPQRYAQVAALLDQVGQLQHAQNAQAAFEQQRREEWANAENQRFDAAVGPRNEEFSAEMVAYSESLGIPKDNLIHLLKTEPVLRSAAFQHVIWTAVTARLAQRKASNWRTRVAPKHAANWRSRAAPNPIPPVVKPGTSTSPRERASADAQALNARLNHSGSLADAFALLKSKRGK
jgi:hypothetical protein